MKKRISIFAMALLLLVGALATFAWLTADTDPIVNRFKFAGIEIELDETFYPETAVIYPGAVIPKVPVVTVVADSANSYVYVEIVNDLPIGASIDIDTNNWTLVKDNIYRYKEVVPKAETDQPLPQLFNVVTVETGLSNEQIDAFENKTITISAFAIQSDAITLEDANTEAIAYFAAP